MKTTKALSRERKQFKRKNGMRVSGKSCLLLDYLSRQPKKGKGKQ